ncbi:MAG: hypothetical protein KOO63_11480 [Bacteroidales bacterium]|nr:hypothetical protein [Candidatus Latescibacterota bacterium]
MRTGRAIRVLLILVAGVIVLTGCDNEALSPNGMGDTRGDYSMYGEVTYDTLYFHSGNGVCGELDTLVTLRYGSEVGLGYSALIGGGNDSLACSCDSIALFMPGVLPVTTLSPGYSTAWFETGFELPEYWRDVTMHLSILADDGAGIFMNGHLLGHVDLLDGADSTSVKVHDLVIIGDSLFVEGTNVLTIMVVNTGTGYFGDPVARADSADCMYVAFDAAVIFAIEGSCEVEIDIKPGSETNPINCRSMNGVIPVAILTTDCFDAVMVDHTTVVFGPAEAGEAHSNKHGLKRHLQDVDFDGDVDMVFHFRGYDTGIVCGDTIATLKGLTTDGFSFESSGYIRTVPYDMPDSTYCDKPDSTQ